MNGQELKALRIRLRMPYKQNIGATQKYMGDLLGITASAVAHIESGKNIMSKPVELLAEQLINATQAGDLQ